MGLNSIHVIILKNPHVLKVKRFVAKRDNSAARRGVGINKNRPMIGTEEIHVRRLEIRESNPLRRVSHVSVQPLKNLVGVSALVILSITWARRVQSVKGISEGGSEVVDLIECFWISSSFFMVIEDLIEVPIYNPTKVRIRVGGCYFIKQIP